MFPQRNPKQLEANTNQGEHSISTCTVCGKSVGNSTTCPLPNLEGSLFSPLGGSPLAWQPLKQEKQKETLLLWAFLFFQYSCQAMGEKISRSM